MDKSENKIQPFSKATSKHYQLLLDADPSKKLVDDYLKDSYNFELVSGKELLGVIVLFERDSNTIEIKNIAVNSEYQNHGLGEKLIRFAINWAKTKHYSFIQIGTGSTSFKQLYLYQKCDFRVTDILSDFFTDNYDEPIIENKLVLRDMIILQQKLVPT